MVKPSKAAIDMIVAFEVTSEAYYNQRYQHPEWPGGASGVTIGVGYDVGYVTQAKLLADWSPLLPPAMVAALKGAVGVKGPAARAMAGELHAIVTVPWAAGYSVFANTDVPSHTTLVANALPNTDLLSGDSFGALVSLVYNRGPSFAKPGDRYTEMRAIKSHMASKTFAAIPDDIRAMRRLWPTVPGLQDRRSKEAALFQAGLA